MLWKIGASIILAGMLVLTTFGIWMAFQSADAVPWAVIDVFLTAGTAIQVWALWRWL